ncbi:amino acid/polyamine transporter I [Mycena sp. CBHHK59/15]|nr:amino acid/polyamine transporter I [Mycena sp. CBHHK59/15]
MSEPDHLAVNEESKNDDIVLLARLGYKQELKREFSIVELFGFGFSVSAIVPSVASVLFYSLPNGGPSAMIWGWATSSVFLMFIAMAMAELGLSAPTSGGLYYWTYKFSSPRCRNLLSWMVGYTNTISYITGVAGVDWSCATLIMAGASLGSDGTFVPTVHQTFGVYCAVLVCHAITAGCATKVLAKLQYTFITINVALVLVMLVGLPAATPAEFKNNARYAFGNFENITPWPNGYAFILSFLAPLVSGFDVGVHISEEAQNANVAVPWAIICVTAIGCTLGFAVQIAVAFCMGTDSIAILSSPVQQPMATILLNSFGKKGMLAIWSFIFVALYALNPLKCTALIGILVLWTHSLFRFSRDGALPFSRFLYNINSFTGTPVRCVWRPFTLGVVGQYVANSIPITARYLGGQEFKRGPFHLGAFSMPVAIIAVLWMWFMTVVLMFPTAPDPVPQTMNYTVVVMGGVLFLALGYYYLPRYGGVHWFNGPVSNIDGNVRSWLI